MTVKRFEINNDMSLDDKVETYELSCIVDNNNKTFYFIVDRLENVQLFIKRLNALHEENKQLKHQIQQQEMEYATDCHRLAEENEQLKEEIKKLYTKIFEMRTNIALERTEISRQTYIGKKNEKEYLTATEFLNEMEKW